MNNSVTKPHPKKKENFLLATNILVFAFDLNLSLLLLLCFYLFQFASFIIIMPFFARFFLARCVSRAHKRFKVPIWNGERKKGKEKINERELLVLPHCSRCISMLTFANICVPNSPQISCIKSGLERERERIYNLPDLILCRQVQQQQQQRQLVYHQHHHTSCL